MTDTDQAHVTDWMIIEWDVPIETDDGLELRADIFRPIGPGPYPVLLSHGPYAKGASFQTGVTDHPHAPLGSLGRITIDLTPQGVRHRIPALGARRDAGAPAAAVRSPLLPPR
jgi:predicted acyl esterase